MPRLAAALRPALIALMTAAALPAADIKDFAAAPHNYWTQPPRDRFTKLFEQIKAGSVRLDESSPNAYLAGLLRALEIPVSSQLLVFSVTSLQSSLISPRNPRALYFNEDTYVGYVPGGRIEIASFDPELGAIFYIFQLPRGGEPPLLDRSNRCFNCHAGSFSHRVPGLFVESVIPGDNGGPLEGFRREESGHGVPYAERFGGWHVTTKLDFPTKANTMGNYYQGRMTTRPNPPGSLFDLQRYLVPTSDIVPQLLHEHQVGFVNRVIEANYTAREKLAAGDGKTAGAGTAELNELATALVRYVLFADEAKLPAPVRGEGAYARDFTAQKKASSSGLSLRDLDLKTRLMKHRCSYMIYSTLWDGMHPLFKQSVEAKLWNALQENSADRTFAYLPANEKREIRQIIKETKTGLPDWWR
jgi:hypothetical protein